MIKIVSLTENTTENKNFVSKHGLSLYIETPNHKIIFDFGPDDTFLKNAKKMNIDLSLVDIAVLSHGHTDHGGGLPAFLRINDRAKIFIRMSAFDKHFIKVLGIPFNVGIDEKILKSGRVVFTDEKTVLDDELTLFACSETRFPKSKSNDTLFMRKGKKLFADDFSHEQNLLITDSGKTLLISGCSHTGIVNIQRQAEQIKGPISIAVGGFHLYNPPTKKYESEDFIDRLATELSSGTTEYYTCHCTGIKAYTRMKLQLADRLNYLHTGNILIIE